MAFAERKTIEEGNEVQKRNIFLENSATPNVIKRIFHTNLVLMELQHRIGGSGIFVLVLRDNN